MSPRRSLRDCPLPIVATASTVTEARVVMARLFGGCHVEPLTTGDEQVRAVLRMLEIGGGLTFAWLSYDAPMRTNAPDGLDSHLVLVPMRGRIHVRRGAQEITARRTTAAVLSPGKPVSMRLGADGRVFAFRIHPEALERHYRMLTGKEMTTPLVFHLEADLNAPRWRRLQRTLTSRLDLIADDPELALTPWHAAGTTADVIMGLLHVQPHGCRRRVPERLPGHHPLSDLLDVEDQGQLLARIRDELGLSQDGLAERVSAHAGKHLARSRVSEWLSNKAIIGHDWLPHVPAALGIPEPTLRRAIYRAKAAKSEP